LAARSLLTHTEGEDVRLLVERMVQGTRELMIGMKRDPSFGPVIVFGVGGIFAEAHKDITLGVTPLRDEDIERMLSGIRARALLDDFRGMPRVDRASLVAAGFGEAGEAGAALESELVGTARSSDVTLIGPNCMGLLSTHSRLHAVGFLELRPQPGGLSIISQSGNIGVQLVTRAERRGVGIEKYVSVGNQATTSALDVLDALGDDPQTEATR